MRFSRSSRFCGTCEVASGAVSVGLKHQRKPRLMEAPQTETKRSRIQIANRALIMEAALDVFSSDGYGGATVDRIAKQAGMSKPNLLYYFPTKEDIYREVLETTVEAWLEPFDRIDPDGNPVEELRFANEIGHGAPLLKPFLETRLRSLVEDKAGVIRGWMETGALRPVDPYHLIFVIWATTQHYADFEVQIGAVMGESAREIGFYERAAEAVLSIILHGIEPK